MKSRAGIGQVESGVTAVSRKCSGSRRESAREEEDEVQLIPPEFIRRSSPPGKYEV